MSDAVIKPMSAFQERYLNANSNIIVAGGAMGSSKSYIGLMRHLRWAEDKHYRGFCFRRNSTTLMKSGGLFEEAVELYRQYDPSLKIRLKDQRLIFDSGASVSFTSYENDQASEKIRGLQFSTAMYDESTDAEENHIWMIISRLRGKSIAPNSIWLTCNPNPDHFLRKWVDWWLYPFGHEKYGLPDPDKNGKERWILRLGGEIVWGDSREELIERYGKPNLPHDHKLQVKPLSFTVLLGTIYDNPALISSSPSYLSALEALPDTEKRRNLYGDWEARQSTSTYFDRRWVQEIDYINQDDVVSTVRTFDWAASLKSDTNPSPDYSASVRLSLMKDGTYVVSDVKRIRCRAGDWVDFFMDCAADDPPNTQYYIPQDPGAAGKRSSQLLVKDLAEAGVYVKRLSTSKSKLVRFLPFSAIAQSENLSVVKNCCTDYENKIYNDNNFFYKELEAFTGLRKRGESGHDDMVDCCSDAFYALASNKTQIANISQAMSGFASSMRESLRFPTVQT